MDNDLTQRFARTARTKWRHLRGQGYHAIHYRSAGVIFGTTEGGEAGHISWWGEVTWLRRDEPFNG